MADNPESSLDRLWTEYSQAFRDFDDLTLARWMAQTLSQLQGRAWRLSHPLIGTYRLAAQLGHDRQIWLKRLVTTPSAYTLAPCCRAPLLPLLTRDVVESGLICQHCSGSAVPFNELPTDLQPALKDWAEQYAPVHAVAHQERKPGHSSKSYDRAFEEAARQAEKLLALAGSQLVPRLLDYYPVVLWEDQDECLEVRPEDIPFSLAATP